MQVPAQITFRHMDVSPALQARIQERIDELEQYCNRITACRVTVEPEHRSHQQGNLFRISIDLVVPGREITIKRGSGVNHAHEDPYVAVRDAFDALRRRLEDHVREGRGQVKAHAAPPPKEAR